MMGCRSLDEGGTLQVGHLFAGFRKNVGNLMLVGILYLVGMMLIGFIAGIGIALMIPFAVGGTNFNPNDFSSLMAMPSFLDSAEARAFTRAYRRARTWAQGTAAEEVTSREAPFFPGVDRDTLTAAIRRYQTLGCWLGNIDITRDLYEQALEDFLSTGAVRQRHPYEVVVVPPPE